MAGKKIAKRKGTSPANIRTKLKQIAKKQEERLSSEGGSFISMQDGEFVYGEDIIPQPMPVIILDYRYVNAYYADDYDPDVRQTPACFAINSERDELAPHPDCEDPQADTCKACEWNKYNTAERGKGKACRNTVRTALTPADKITAANEVAMLSFPPTSLKSFNGYIRKTINVSELPSFGYITELSTEALGNKRAGHKIVPSFVDELDDEQLAITYGLYEECQEDIEAPFQPAEEDEAPKPTRRKAAKKKVAKKKAAKKKTARRY